MAVPVFFKYLKITIKESKRFSSPFIPWLKYYFRWKKYLTGGSTSIDEEIPWMNFEAIDFLKRIAHPSLKVFEYGSGGSTFFWADRVSQIISIEHDETWANKVISAIKAKTNATVFFVPPQEAIDYKQKNAEEPTDYISTDESSVNKSYENYVKKINDYPNKYFDIVIVDGRARPSCIIAARSKIKPGGFMVVDNTEREYYLKNTLPVLKQEGWVTLEFIGPVPYLKHFCKTTIFQKPSL